MVWAVSLSTTKLSPRRLTQACSLLAFAVWLGLVTSTWPRAHPALYLQQTRTPGCTSMHFGENQLSPRSVGISPLSTGHPPVLQHWWVRASTAFHSRFTLPMDSSRGFGSVHRYCSLAGPPSSDSVSLRLPSLPEVNPCNDEPLAGSFYKRHAISPCWPLATVTSDCLCVRGFRLSFIPLPGRFSPFPHGTGPLSVAEGL